MEIKIPTVQQGFFSPLELICFVIVLGLFLVVFGSAVVAAVADRRRLSAETVFFFVVVVVFALSAALDLNGIWLTAVCRVHCIRFRTPATVANYLH